MTDSPRSTTKLMASRLPSGFQVADGIFSTSSSATSFARRHDLPDGFKVVPGTEVGLYYQYEGGSTGKVREDALCVIYPSRVSDGAAVAIEVAADRAQAVLQELFETGRFSSVKDLVEKAEEFLHHKGPVDAAIMMGYIKGFAAASKWAIPADVLQRFERFRGKFPR